MGGWPVMSDGLRSGELAAAAGVNVQTLRYYERRGLLDEPDRTLGGHRVYAPDAVIVLRVIKAAQRLGFTLDDVADLLEPVVTTTTADPCATACRRGPRRSWPRLKRGWRISASSGTRCGRPSTRVVTT